MLNNQCLMPYFVPKVLRSLPHETMYSFLLSIISFM
uniref:Uncharacterized protein n=1 Tax=Siphoviridae sp. ctqPo10 TaxID=2827948 RepID=A0A8S5SVY4_9CAUD|nr:MAG TPA: hypothetical protein [Siphoviridae sp. ctqPo10]